MSLSELMIPAPPSYTFTKDYRDFLETVIHHFRISPNAPVLDVSGEVKHVYRFDLEGYLISRGVSISEHYLVMRINELENLHNLDITQDYLLLPDPDLLRNINSIYRSKMKK